MSSTIANTLEFLVGILFESYIFIVILRLFLQAIRAEYANPISQFAYKFTQPLLKPLKKILPAIGVLDMAIIVLIVSLNAIKITLIATIKGAGLPNVLGLLLWSASVSLEQVATFIFYIIICRVIAGWVQLLQHYIIDILCRITDPLLRPIARKIPLVGGFDLSPIVLLIALKVISMLFLSPMIMYSARLAY